jgi:hypothetical protein
MTRSDLLISLVRAGAAGDRDVLKSTTEALVAEERAKKHHIVADRLERALAAVPITPPPLTNASVHTTSGKEAILELQPRVRLSDLILPLPVQENGRQLVEEHVRSDVLRAHGYEPRHRVLLSGPPGNGKTSFAEGVAEALGLPFFVVRYDCLIGSYLGETNGRLRRLFDYVRTRASVLFFPFPHFNAPNPSSALGPGFAKAVKPDILMPGAREHLNVVLSDGYIRVLPAQASRAAGLKVAAPPRDGIEAVEGAYCQANASYQRRE